MSFDRKQLDYTMQTSRVDGNLAYPSIPLARQAQFITTDSSASILADGYFNAFQATRIGDLIHVIIVDDLNPLGRSITPIYLLVQVIAIDSVVRVRLVLSSEGTTSLYTGNVNVAGNQLQIVNGMVINVL